MPHHSAHIPTSSICPIILPTSPPLHFPPIIGLLDECHLKTENKVVQTVQEGGGYDVVAKATYFSREGIDSFILKWTRYDVAILCTNYYVPSSSLDWPHSRSRGMCWPCPWTSIFSPGFLSCLLGSFVQPCGIIDILINIYMGLR